LGHLGLGGAGDLVVVGLFGLLALVAGGNGAATRLVAWQLVVDGDLAGVVGGQARFFPGLARAQHAAFGIGLVGSCVILLKSKWAEGWTRASQADNRGHDVRQL